MMPALPSWARTLALVVFPLVALVHSACTHEEANSGLSRQPSTTYPMPPVNSNHKLSEMGWEMINGKRGTVADYQNKVLVLDFYATWCPPCRKSIPQLVALQERFGARGLQIIGLNVGGADDVAKVPAFARENNIQYPLGLPDDELSTLLLSTSDEIPQTFVFDRQGRLAKRFIGYGDATSVELERSIEAVLEISSP